MLRLGKVFLLSFSIAALAVPITSNAQILSITIAPPALPVYVQPAIPEPGYMWTPGYWAYGPDGYFWVPGTWVRPPSVGLLWTPGYWGWRDGVYVWNDGYWGPHIGFYGGVNYGFGYGGIGYGGGYWNHGVFAYNSSVNNFGGVTITNVYNKTVIVNSSVTSFNGGTGGTTAQPTPQEQAASQEQHVAATPAQAQHQQMASTNRALLASENHGQPAVAATAKPGEFSGKGVVAARQATPGAVTPGAKPASGAAAPSPTAPSNRASLGSGTAPKTLSTNTEAKPLASTPPGAKPAAGAAAPSPNASGNRASLGSGTPPKTLSTNAEAKPLASAPPKVASKPSPPPHAVTAAARPAAPAVARHGPPPKKPRA